MTAPASGLRYGTWDPDATTYGPMPDGGLNDYCLVIHTTETSGMPGFSGGDTKPHFVYDPKHADAGAGGWTQHAELNRRVGTMRGSSSTGVWCNERAIQVEVICYSDKSVADDSSSRLWVGDFNANQYAALARFYRWIMDNTDVDETVWGPSQQFPQFMYGTGADTRMGKSFWYDFCGITGHGGAHGQSHWDPGVLDLYRVRDLAVGATPPWPTEPPPTEPPGITGTPFVKAGQIDLRQGREFYVEEVQAIVGLLNGYGSPDDSNRAVIDAAGMELGVWDTRSQELLTGLIGHTTLGPTERRELDAMYRDAQR